MQFVRSDGIPIRAHGFLVHRLAGWHAGVGQGGLPVFANFPWSKMQAQLRLPKGGATINITDWDGIPRRRGDGSLAGWAELDAVIAAQGTVVSKTLNVPEVTGIPEALQVSFDEATYGPDDQEQHDVPVSPSFYPAYFQPGNPSRLI